MIYGLFASDLNDRSAAIDLVSSSLLFASELNDRSAAIDLVSSSLLFASEWNYKSAVTLKTKKKGFCISVLDLSFNISLLEVLLLVY